MKRYLNLRILSTWNIANAAYNATKAMRKYGLNANLLLPGEDWSVFSDPAWEDNQKPIIFKPNNPATPLLQSEIVRHGWTKPDWIHFTRRQRSPLYDRMPKTLNQMITLTIQIAARYYGNWIMDWGYSKNYDVQFSHSPTMMYSQFTGVPYVVYDAGLIRHIPYPNPMPIHSSGGKWKVRHTIVFNLLKRSYEKAKAILYTNPDTYTRFKENGLEDKLIFTPFFIDADRYTPRPNKDREYEYNFTMPSRQHWGEKGNDKAIKAFKLFQRRHPGSALYLMSWGSHYQQSKFLCRELKLKNVFWMPIMNKTALMEFYRKIDVVLDQFNLGSYGSTAPEGMSCAKPVIMYLDQKLQTMTHGEPAPILNARTIEEIHNAMEYAYKHLDKIGQDSREYVKRIHNAQVVAQKHLEAIDRVLND